MKRAGNILTGIGATLFILSACCLDSPSYIFGLIAVVGIVMVATGYRMGGKHGK